ncbi:MAG: ABC transporter permease subunit [Chloroflexi bacterium]|nr:ABC transporter permease subunit [Chloroflexota bacterium]
MSGIIAIPIGGFVGSQATTLLLNLSDRVSGQGVVGIGVVVISLAAAWALLNLGPPIVTDKAQTRMQQSVSTLRMLLSSLIAFFGIGVLTNVGVVFGNWLEGNLGRFGFLGGFGSLVSDTVRVMSPVIVGLFLALSAASFGSKYGQEAVLRMRGTSARIVTGITTGLGAAIFLYGIGASLDWLYQYDEPQFFTLYPAIIGGLVMLVVGLMVEPKRPFPIGFTIYTSTRSLLNMIRSMEPLIYVIVFAVWVGIGPFAGVLALTGHTIAALGKLFSEQVENISEGPLEAITATGANSIQTIVFGVIPQIVPPYIAFTLYRWDINVRMSTIIGFGGGGGIGFVLVQNINLLQYRQASVMMIAIAIVVMSLDYISSKIRTRII